MKITELPREYQSSASYMWSYSRALEESLTELGIVLEKDEVENKYQIKIGPRRNNNNNILKQAAHEMQMLSQRYREDLVSPTLSRFADQLACNPNNLIELSTILSVPIATTENLQN